MKKNQEMLKSGNFLQLILHLCIPTIIIMLVTVLYNMADTFFIGKTNEAAMIASVSIAGPLFSLLSGIGTLFGTGGCTAISIWLGEGRKEKVNAAASLCLWGSIIVSVIFMIIMYGCMDRICYGLGCDEDTFAYTKTYVQVITLGAPCILFSNIFTNLIRADGNAVASLITNLIGSFVNIFLDAFFVMGLHWDVFGVAFATVLGNLVSCIYLIYHILRKQDTFRMSFSNCFDKEVCKQIITLGMPLACSTLLMSISHALANNLMSSYGMIALSASGVAGKISMLISMVQMGICMGFQPAISYSLGKHDFNRMHCLIKDIALLTIITGSILTILCLGYRETLVRMFIDDAEVIEQGMIMVIAGIIIGPVYGLYQLCLTFLQATGKASYATLVSIMDKGIIYIPVLLIMNACFGAYGIAFTSSVTLILSLLMSVLLSMKWKKSMLKQAL